MIDRQQREVLDFWFRSADTPMPQFDLWFAKSEKTDEEIRQKFQSLVVSLASGRAFDWVAESTKAALAAIIVLDQFPRNIWRGTPKSFAYDSMALSIANDLILFGKDKELPPLMRWFAYMPLEHAEDKDEQRASVSAFTELVKVAPSGMEDLFENARDYAIRHADVIDRFGRFPHRNAILGRPSTPEEEAWLSEHGGF